jgi:type III pantothenate kinase
MLLAVDVGNTNTAFAVFDGQRVRADWHVSTLARRTGDEYAALLNPLFCEVGISFAQVDGVVISSVVPATIDALLRLSKNHLKVSYPTVLSPDIDLGIKINYHPITDVGADRIANAIAAHAKYGGKVIVVDLGTGTTLDAVSEDGEYLGGAIAPGIQISLDALVAHAAKLTSVQLIAPPKAIGETTSSSLQSGMIFGFAGQIDALVGRFQQEMGGGARVIATGGLAPIIAEHSRTIELCDDLLTLEGLRIIHEHIRKV